MKTKRGRTKKMRVNSVELIFRVSFRWDSGGYTPENHLGGQFCKQQVRAGHFLNCV